MKILTYPDEFLSIKADEVTDFSEHLREISENMIQSMYINSGVGLASIQVGIKDKIFVIDISEDKDNPIVMVNPQITAHSNEREKFEEGCLSVPGIRRNVIRSIEITLEWQDRDGNEQSHDFGTLAARVIQHELDHLEGILFIKRLGPVDKMLIRKSLKKLKEGLESA